MIRINIEVDTVGQARLALRELLGENLTEKTTEEEQVAPPKPRGRGKAATSTEGNAAGTAENGSTEEPQAASPSTAPSATTSPSDLRDEVRTKGVKYGQPHNGGQGALKELITQFGSATGKFSGIPDEQLPALNARLDELLVDAK